MKIEKASQRYFANLCKYNTRIYPEKTIASQCYLEFWLTKKDAQIEDWLILKDDDGEIHGQILATPMSFFLKGKQNQTVWLFDLIVDEELRKSAWGVDMLLQCMEAHPASCSTGSGPTALPLHLKLGNKMLGEIRKYVGIVNPLYLLTSYRRSVVAIKKYPQQVASGLVQYRRIAKDELPLIEVPFNDSLLEIGRDKSFLEWRFFSGFHQYAFYIAEDGKSYFVVRSILLKGFRVLELVDYRCKADEKSFECILKAVHQVAKKVCLPVVVCGSTLAPFDAVLELYNYRSIGRPRPVIGFVKCKDRKEDIAQRNFCFVTLADSDGETNWI